MQRAIFRFTNGEHLNIPADFLGKKDGVIEAWNSETLVANAKVEQIEYCYIIEVASNQKTNK